MTLQSLRARLILIILTPLLLIAVAAAFWQFRNATHRAEEIFDRGLLSAALAISRDVALSGGDALSPSTRSLITDTSGGELLYHVYAPDGVFVTGYATPPVPPDLPALGEEPLFYDAAYKGRDVRVLRFRDVASVDGLNGVFTVTVWQDQRVRLGFLRDVVTRSVGVIAVLVVSLALVVWFGVGIGLRPLLDLQDAIAKRTPSELEPIRRYVPVEVQGIVSTLNSLLDRVSRRISSKDEFISNAAHQLRNPIAGVLALAEAVESAPTAEAAKTRSAELVVAARNATHLTNQLLSFERAKGSEGSNGVEDLELNSLIATVVARFQSDAVTDQIAVNFAGSKDDIVLPGDAVMLQEAVLNLMNNAVIHGGNSVSHIDVSLVNSGGCALIDIQDDGVGIDADKQELALGRFSQANAGPGSGLGLPIAAQVVENHGGRLTIEPSAVGALIRLRLPLEGLSAQHENHHV